MINDKNKMYFCSIQLSVKLMVAKIYRYVTLVKLLIQFADFMSRLYFATVTKNPHCEKSKDVNVRGCPHINKIVNNMFFFYL